MFSFHSTSKVPKIDVTIIAKIEEIMIKSINHAINLSDHLAIRSSKKTSEFGSDIL
jgi:hypothetical protein